MSWLARLKNKVGTETDATKPTKPGFVGFVAYPQTPFENSHPDSDGLPVASANDESNDIAIPRMALFMDRGLTGDDAQILADRLTVRDLRGDDDRRVCLECLHLSGTVNSRRCGQWRMLGNSSPATVADLADILQRCPGFNPIRDEVRSNHAEG